MDNQNYTNQLLKSFKKEKFILVLEIIFGGGGGGLGADMQLISKFNKNLDSYYVLLIFLVNMFGSFH